MNTMNEQSASKSAMDLIQLAKRQPPQPILEGLFSAGEIMLVHGSEECFKSVFILQAAESVATCRPLFGWRVTGSRKVGVIETELHETRLGERLSRMFSRGNAPENLRFFDNGALREWKRQNLRQKIESIQGWVDQEQINVLMIDTANDFFRGGDSASHEGHVGEFFDELRGMRVDGRVIVRHDRKKSDNGNPNDKIRGSGEWREDPEVIVSLKRTDRRTHEVVLSVDKQRYGQKPGPLTLWFDAATFRLTALPPVIEVIPSGMQRSRKEILDECEGRFNLAQRKVDEMLGEQSAFLTQHQQGHEKCFEINLDTALAAPWSSFLGAVEPKAVGEG